MKRALFLLLAFVGIAVIYNPVHGQDASTAAAVAAREEAEERARQLSADMENLHAANQALEQRINALEQVIKELRDAQAKAANNSGVQDDLKRLAEKIEEVDRKRAEDKQAISEQIKQSASSLEKTLAVAPPTQTHTAALKVQASEASKPEKGGDKGYVYTVQSGDFLSAIVKAYNADFKSKGQKTITLKQVMEANPGMDWNRLQVGQKIVIPKPGE
jgi:LysM repeat protein